MVKVEAPGIPLRGKVQRNKFLGAGSSPQQLYCRLYKSAEKLFWARIIEP